jgi:hypothetical protein
MATTTTNSTIVVVVIPAYAKVKNSKKFYLDGKVLDTRKKPHAIDVALGQNITLN